MVVLEEEPFHLESDFSHSKPFRYVPPGMAVRPYGRFQGRNRSRISDNCCKGVGLIGLLLIVTGVLILVYGQSLLWEVILSTLSIEVGSEGYKTWLKPPAQSHLSVYAFNLTNPNEVLNGAKPRLQEVGPYVYKATTVKDLENLTWNSSDSTLTYRAKTFYEFVPELSDYRIDYDDVITVPNVPLWTSLNAVKRLPSPEIGWSLLKSTIEKTGHGSSPFINVSVGGLLWGYEDDLACTSLHLPRGCKHEETVFSHHDEDEHWPEDHDLFKANATHSTQAHRPMKADFVNCSCHWGLFRGHNGTMQEPIRFSTGKDKLFKRGSITQFNGRKSFGWWLKDSHCDDVGGQDGSTLPADLDKENHLEIFFPWMCRKLPLTFEKEVKHEGVNTYRFAPPSNALGSPHDKDPLMRNKGNQCYCMSHENFRCFKSGVFNLAPCKKEELYPPIALSMPHFYQADPSFIDAVVGLSPDKKRHQFYLDVVPEFGYPFALKPRLQLNLQIFKFDLWTPTSNLTDELVLPVLWLEEGFDSPSQEIVDQTQGILFIQELIPTMLNVLCLVIGGLMFGASVAFYFVRKTMCRRSRDF